MKQILNTAPLSDDELVQRSRHGDRDAFGRIVERYQSLICALTYSTCGSFQGSEDLAQVTFITAWSELGKLREPAHLKSWLCGIARNVANNSLRQQRGTPTADAEPLETGGAPCSGSLTPRDDVISREEEAILWRTLAGLPATYREPLVLFYRQQQSVAAVAAALGVSEEAVRQRLSRGRAMLSEKVARLVETTLRTTGPTKAFTLAAVAALPLAVASASAATVGATVVKGAGTAKAMAGGWLGAILSPVLGFFSFYIGRQMGLASATSDAERVFVKKLFRIIMILILAFAAVMLPVIYWGKPLARAHPGLYAGLIIGLSLGYAGAVVAVMVWSSRRQRLLADKDLHAVPARPAWEYRSKLTLLGLPLVQARMGGSLTTRREPVKGWIAVGEKAYGVVFAFGGIAVAPLCIGGLAVGVFPFGGFAIGLLPLGGFALGPWATGGLACGWFAFGGSAVAWQAAVGGLAVAREFALGAVAVARHANDAAAQAFVRQTTFFPSAVTIMRYIGWVHLLWFVPLVVWWRVVKARAAAKLGTSNRQP
ncbi:sigma-70 family RNA polymerase sigma factor [bacterium]|nr:sigma-70 family RNA polymerase sigma factor [bacterium]